MRLTLFASALMWLTSCDCGPLPIESKKYACATAADCAAGEVCIAGVCEANAGVTNDAGREDAGTMNGSDAGSPDDAGSDGDGGADDSGVPDSGVTDSGVSDGGASDSGMADAGSDGGPVDPADGGPCVLTGLNPTSQGALGTVVLSGTNLNNPLSVTFGGGPDASIAASTSTSLSAVVPAGSASGTVVLTTPTGSCSIAGFTFVPAPSITSFAPDAGAAGTSITIIGTNLANATSVTFGGGPSANIVSNTATSVVAQVPAGSASGSVTVTTVGGSATASGFVFLPPPTITGFFPAAQDPDGVVTIVGTQLGGLTQVRFGSSTSATVVSASATAIVVRVPNDASSGDVSVSTAFGTATRSGFTLITAPRITSIISPSNNGVVSGCVQITYVVAHEQAMPADIVVEYDASGGSFAAATRCTQARGAPGVEPNGVQGVRTASAGVSHTFSWNSTADLPGVDTSGVALRVRAKRGSRFGTAPAPLTGLTVANGLRFNTLTAPIGSQQSAILVADLNRDGKLDGLTSLVGSGAIVAIYGVDGGFASPQTMVPNSPATGFASADFNGDGKIDVAGINSSTGASVVVFIGVATVVPIDAGVNPTHIISGEVTGDGRPDLVITNGTPGTVRILASDGTTTMTPFGGPYSVGAGASGAAIGDIDLNGAPDIVVANKGANVLRVMLGVHGSTPTVQPASVTLSPTASPNSIALADVNDDGKLDAITGNTGSSTFSLLLGAGNGTFGSPTSIAAGATPDGTLVVADMTNDGKLDLIASASATNQVIIVRGLGNGQFSAPMLVTVGAKPQSLAVADINRDGRLDIITANANHVDGTVLINAQAPRCTVGAEASSAIALDTFPLGVATGDFNADGKLDAVSANFSANNMSLLLGLGDGTYATATTVTTDTGPTELAVGDLNADGKPDVAVANFTAGTVSILIGNGAGGFATMVNYGVGAKPRHVVLDDVTLDGVLDVVTTSSNDPTVSVLRGNGNGTFATASDSTVEAPHFNLGMADFDLDTTTDLVAGGAFQVAFMKGDGGGSFSFYRALDAGAQPTSLTVCDLNADPWLDVGVANFGDSTVTPIFVADGGAMTGTTFSVGSHPISIATGDFNRDGKGDLVTVNRDGQDFSLLSSFDGGFIVTSMIPAGRAPSDLAVADMNADGIADLLSSSNYLNSTGTFSTSLLTTVFGTSDGMFGPKVIPTGSTPNVAAVADLNRDGVLDLVTANSLANSLSVVLGERDGGFAAPTALSTTPGTLPFGVVLTDVSHDGKADLLVALAGSGQITYRKGNGDGSFGSNQFFTVGSQPRRLVTGDCDRDGELDVAVINQASNDLTIIRSIDTVSATVTHMPLLGQTPLDIAAEDFNRDGILDLAIVMSATSTINMLIGVGDCTFSTPQTTATGNTPIALAAGDLNADGITDVVTANLGGDSVSVFYGSITGALTQQPVQQPGSGPTDIALGDVDGDGFLDIISAHRDSNAVVITRLTAQGVVGRLPLGSGNATATIRMVDLNRDGALDILTLNSNGIVPLYGRH